PTALAGALRLPRHRPTFLSPFDNLIWFRPRDERLFDFHYRIEIYTPAPKRQFGYYVLPLLAGGALVGRADLKIERKERRLRCHALYLHDGATPSDAAEALRSLAAHLGAETIALDRVEPAAWASEVGRLLTQSGHVT
ncbi:MAG TPA: crosslink repair DNA glycosylase YcaQ family protein, partial [Chloroflexota bacterium]